MPDNEEQLEQSWAANADAWTEAVRDGAIESRRLVTDAAIVRAVAARAAGRALDVGCGEGWLARVLADRGFEVVGVDGSAPLIARAREQGGGAFHVLSYREIVAAPVRLGGPYDAIICNFSLLGADITALLSALSESLGGAGQLFVQTVHPFTACGGAAYRDGWRTETFDAFGGAFPTPMPWYFRTVGTWLAALHGAGLAVEECLEPIHPATGRPLSLLLICRPFRY
jgi:2-polyprenyl-3-methyl-5-hydroxy-6-metoxy-1,4-benzoquinol methylase